MSRAKRSRDEAKSEDDDARSANDGPAAALAEHSSGEDDNPKTPSKKVRLNLANSGDSGAVEEAKAVSYAVGGQRGLFNDQENDHAVITPGLGPAKSAAAATSAESIEETILPEAPNSARRLLFTPSDAAKPQLVTPSRSKLTTAQSPAKRKLVFGRYTTEIGIEDKVKNAYAIVRKLTGSIGGNASNGPIYGELTMGSMQKMVNLMKEHTSFDGSSRFIDVGSGIGKPNFHVAHDPGVEVSLGLEVDGDRWLLSMNCLKGTLDDHHATQESSQQVVENQQKCIFIHGDIRQARVFDPFTHVYMFSIGFPPELWVHLSEMWNQSTSPYLICFHGPRDIIQSYEFHVELLAQTPTSMHGSKEGHMGYVYRRKGIVSGASASADIEDVHIDPLFASGIKMVRGSSLDLKTWVDKSLNDKMKSGPATRTRRRSPTTK